MTSQFGRSFHTRKQANAYLKQIRKKQWVSDDVRIRKMSKKIHPRRKKLFHVGSKIDFLNFA
jgi:hypothetical protein